MSRGRKRWRDLTTTQRVAVAVLGGVEVALTAISLVDLARRPSAEVRGPKLFWALAVFVQPFGPVAYLSRGRRPAADS